MLFSILMMSVVKGIAPVVVFFTIKIEVTAGQCTDPLIYKLNDIQELITNLAAKQEKQQANLTYCTAQIESYREQLNNQAQQLEKQVRIFHLIQARAKVLQL